MTELDKLKNELIKKVQPKKWSGTLCKEEVADFLCKCDDKVAIKKTISMIGFTKWGHKKLQAVIETKEESWNLQDEYEYLLVWQEGASLSSPPDAIMSFYFNIIKLTKNNKIESFILDSNLIWVNPKKRRQGLGRHLIVHFLNYLKEFNMSSQFVSKQGIELTFFADYYSKGGERLSKHIIKYFNRMKKQKIWPINKIEIEADY